MADDRTIAPGPARWRRAWRAGVRPQSRWLLPAVLLGGLAMVLPGVDLRAWGAQVRPGALSPDAWLGTVVRVLAVGWALVGLAVLVVATGLRRLGGISTRDRRRLGAAPSSPAVAGALGLAGLAGLGLVLALGGILAGAARSVDASEAGLGVLWGGWVTRGTAALAMGLGLAALGERLLDRRDRAARLRQSHQQVRDDARASGAR